MSFLADFESRPVNTTLNDAKSQLYLGQGPNALEIIYLQSNTKPNGVALKNSWKSRHANRAVPV